MPRPNQIADPIAPTHSRTAAGATIDVRVRSRYGAAVRDALVRLREALHAVGELSSRHEALDEVSALFLAHALDSRNTDRRITRAAVASAARAASISLAAALRAAVADVIDQGIATTGPGAVDPAAFALRLRDHEDKLAAEYLDVLDQVPRAADVFARDEGGAVTQSGSSQAVAYDVMNHLFSQFLSDSFTHERELGQYLTPDEVVTTMVDMALAHFDDDDYQRLLCASPHETFGHILDPSCGVASFLGRFVHGLLPRASSSLDPTALTPWLRTVWRHQLVGIDKSPRMLKMALASATLFGADHVQLHRTNGLDRSPAAAPVLKQLEGKVGLILTNPPFGAEFRGDALTGFQLAPTGVGRRAVNSELLFLERHFDWLREGGRLLSVVPDSILSNKGTYAHLRDIMRRRGRLVAVVSLPTSTFGLAGTQTKTSILVMHKLASAPVAPTFFFISRSLGFEVVTKGSNRTRIPTDDGDIDDAVAGFKQAIAGDTVTAGRFVVTPANAHRWDASYHAGLGPDLQRAVDGDVAGTLRVSAVAALRSDRVDPRRQQASSFRYIEISGLDAATLRVNARTVERDVTPSRARRLVAAGDVLVSTVRPTLRCIGVVPPQLDGAVCTTGLAVLQPRGIDPYLLARLLQSDAVVAQLIRNNVGIAYPAFEEALLPDVVLPIRAVDLQTLDASAAAAREAMAAAERQRRQTDSAIDASIASWLGGMTVGWFGDAGGGSGR